ncbi:MAG: hypothetical protein R3349_00860, partial [Geminicoccaceae bacterium]|nr:hypothetical protein [Geminicoccaceae bacterium]
PLEVVNGDLVRLAPGPAEVIDEVPVGRLVLDDGKILTAGDDLFRTRRRLSSHGTIVVGLVLDGYGSLLAAPKLSVVGTIDLLQVEGGPGGVVQTVEDAVEALDDEAALDDEQIRIAIRASLRRGLGLSRERRPIIEVQITRLGQEALAGLTEEAEAT